MSEASPVSPNGPVYQLYPLNYSRDSTSWFRRLYRLGGAVWLDSGEAGSHNSRYDILTALPRQQICQLAPDQIQVTNRSGHSQLLPGSAFGFLQHALYELGLQADDDAPRNRVAGDDNTAELPFVGGAIGYLSYESLHTNFGLQPPTAAGGLPHLYFGIYDWALVQDHVSRTTTLCVLQQCPEDVMARVRRALTKPAPELSSYSCSGLSADIGRETYLAAVEKIKHYIYAGDCYQVNFAQRFSGTFQGSTASAYVKLRQALPSPFSAYVATPAGDLLSLSPERFIEIDGRQLRTQPIKGTARRGNTQAEDAALARELQLSAKNRAENVMIVDLLRNDLSKVSEPFSVEVPELFGLQSFANVHHLVSTVTGRLRPDCDWREVLQAAFPGGSITGAPKKRAMEIINELEQHERSVYCGSIIYLSLNGRMDSNIAIRTLVQKDSSIYCWGGGGIVADSDPEAEYQETLHKVGLLLRTLSSADDT